MIHNSTPGRKNDEWISDSELPDPSPLPRVLGWQLLVRPLSIRSKTKGGLILPDAVKDDLAFLTTVGRVLAVGPMAYRDDTGGEPWCKVGDYICYGKFKGIKFLYRGVRLLLLDDRDALLAVSAPEDIDPSFALTKGS